MKHPASRSALALAVLVAFTPRANASAIRLVEDNLPSVERVLASGPGTPPAAGVLAYELAHSRELDQLFYRDRSPAQKLALARAGLAAPVAVAELRRFAAHWRADFEAVATQLEAIGGRPASPAVSMWYCLDSRVGVLGVVNETPTLGLNARPLLPYDPSHTRLAFAAEIFRYQASQTAAEAPESLTLARRFQVVGLTLAAMQRAVPGLASPRYLGVDAPGFQAYARNRRAIARGLIAALQRPESATAMQRFFGRGTGDPWPAGAGRYIAWLAARRASHQHDLLELYGLPSSDYMFQVMPLLQDVAGLQDGVTP